MATYDFSISSLYLSRGIPDQKELDHLVNAGIFKLEVALSSWFPESTFLKTQSLSTEILERCRSISKVLESRNIAVAGLHSVFYESTGLNVFSRCTDTLDYLVSRIRYCDDLGGRFVVIGSPTVRNTELSRKSSWANYCWLLNSALEKTKSSDVKILTEALPTCPVFSSVFDLLQLVEYFECSRLGLHMDLNSMMAANELIAVRDSDFKRIEHVHINDSTFNPVAPGHRQAELTICAEILEKNSYDGLVGLEYVTPSGLRPNSGQLLDSSTYVKNCLNDSRHWC